VAKVSRETFGFTQDFQDLILACVLKRPEFVKYASVINPKFFTGSVSTLTARSIFDYHKRRRTYPTKEVLIQIVAEEAKKSQEDATVVHEYVNKLFKIKTIKVWEEVHQKVIAFCRERAILRALKLSIDHFKEGTVPEDGYVKLFEEAVAVGVDLDESLQFDPKLILPDQTPTLTLAGRSVCTRGNITTVAGVPKAGKSAAVGAMIAAMLPESDEKLDCLGFAGSNPEGWPIIHLDCEHSLRDYHRFMDRVLKRAGLGRKSFPQNRLQTYTLKRLNADQRWAKLKHLLAEAHEKYGGVALVIADTITDFSPGVNDDKLAETRVGELCSLADRYDTSIVVLIHFNPLGKKGDGLKMRGHLGSELARKAETNLQLFKSGEDEVTAITASENRQGGIAGAWAPCFKFDPELGLHVSCAPAHERNAVAKALALRELAADVLKPGKDGPAASLHKDLVELVMVREECGESTAKGRIKALVSAGLVKKRADGTYIPGESL
jgi:hypothetical protein